MGLLSRRLTWRRAGPPQTDIDAEHGRLELDLAARAAGSRGTDVTVDSRSRQAEVSRGLHRSARTGTGRCAGRARRRPLHRAEHRRGSVHLRKVLKECTEFKSTFREWRRPHPGDGTYSWARPRAR